MTNGPLHLLLDTNVLLDEYLPERPHAETSRALIQYALEHGHTLLYSARAVADVHYIISKTFKDMARAERGILTQTDALTIQSIAQSCIRNLCEIATAVGLDQSDVWLACRYQALTHDFEDAFVLAAAERAHADFLVTSDEALLRHATIAALTPADMLTLCHARE